jgi:AcrR family transcriptional regulator
MISSLKPAKSLRGKAQSSKGLTSREKLLRTAIDQYARHGYEAVSTGAIARAAGLDQSMVHYHFGSKDKTWYAAVELLMAERGEVFPIGSLDLRDLDPLARLKVIIRKLILVNATHPQLAQILMHEGAAPGPRLRWLVKQYMADGYSYFEAALADAVEAKLIRPLPIEHLAHLIVAACTLTHSHWALVREVHEIDVQNEDFIVTFSDTVVDVLFNGLETRKSP